MKKTCVAIKDNNSKKKNWEGGLIQWQYFDIRCEILSNDLNRSLILESGVGLQVSKRKVPTEMYEDVDEPCAHSSATRGKGCQGKKLESQWTHQIQLEQQRLGAVNNLVKEVEESNRTKKERNNLLRPFLDKLDN